MYRAVKTGRKWYGLEVKGDCIEALTDEEIENINEFISCGECVLLGDNKEDMEDAVDDSIDWL